MAFPAKSKILVAMSGGVDSSVAACLLVEQGYEVVGLTMRLVPEELATGGLGDDDEHRAVFQPCCSAEMAEDARQAADLLGFPHYTLNLVDEFERDVIHDFTSEYLEARTPNPCIRCNQRLKYGALVEKAAELGADAIATGHYVRVAQLGNRRCIQRAVDQEKNQSYVMGGLTQEQLAKAIFPLGEMTKQETRAKARELGLRAADTPESQDICFVPRNDYKEFLERRAGAMPPGPILSPGGEVLGKHKGLLRYTVGQRKGLGIGSSRPLYVIRLDRPRNALIVGHEEETFCTHFSAGECLWGGLAPRDEAFDCHVQIRYRHEPVPCTVTPAGETFEVVFREPERAVTPGQWAVMYDDAGRVLAAAIINTFEPTSIAQAKT